MNAPALNLHDKPAKDLNFIRLSLSLGPAVLEDVRRLLEQHAIQVLADLSHLEKKDRCCLLLDCEINALGLAPFSKWLLKQAKLKSLITRLENADGKAIAECRLYCDGKSSF